MPSQQEVKWSQLKIGVIVLVSIALLCSLLFLMTSASGMSVFSKKIIAHTYFNNSAGLKVGGAVNLEGVTIGEVTKVLITTDPARKQTPVLVIMKIDPKYNAGLHTDSTASLSTVGVLGDTVVDINSRSATGPEIKDGDELKNKPSTGINDVVESSQKTLETLNISLGKLNNILDTVQKGQGSVGKIINDPQLYNEATGTVAELHTLTHNINSGKGSVGKLMHDDELYNRLNDTASKLDLIADDLNSGKGSAGKLLKDDSLYNNLNATLTHANSLLAQVDSGKGSLGVLVKDPAFANKLTDTVDKLDTLLSNVNSGKGTLGKFATDDGVYNNLDHLLSSSNDLVGAIRTDPKKYLTFHVKIF
jgi:phospholipid/cholesterol/gamma-HCH transport system substrate-binding protein